MFSCQDLGINHEGSWYLNNLLGFVRGVSVQGILGDCWSAYVWNAATALLTPLLSELHLSVSNLLHPTSFSLSTLLLVLAFLYEEGLNPFLMELGGSWTKPLRNANSTTEQLCGLPAQHGRWKICTSQTFLGALQLLTEQRRVIDYSLRSQSSPWLSQPIPFVLLSSHICNTLNKNLQLSE